MSEMPNDDYPHGQSYGALLAWHLKQGTRSDGRVGEWSTRTFAKAVYKLRDDVNGVSHDFRGKKRDVEHARKSIENWSDPEEAPPIKSDIAERILELLFGQDPFLAIWRDDLIRARERHYAEKKAARAQLTAQKEDRPARQSRRGTTRQPAKTSVSQLTPHFMGRDQERDQIVDLLTSPNGPTAILVQGGPGMGKTELAKAVGHEKRVTRHFGNRRWFVSLAVPNDAEEIEDIVAEGLGWGRQNGFRDALDALREKPSLIILDGLEGHWERSEQRPALESALAALSEAGASLIATVRGVADVRGAQWQRKPILQALSPEDAANMFASISGNEKDDPNFRELNAALGGIPLAVQLMALRANGRGSLAPLRRDWEEHGIDILCLPNEPLGPLTSFAEAMRLAMGSERLTPDGRRLLSILGFLPASMLEEDIRSMMGYSALAAEESLIRTSLVLEKNDRFEILPPVKDYVKRHLIPTADDIALATTRYLDLIVRSGAAIGMNGDAGNLRRVESEIENIEYSIFVEFNPDGPERIYRALEGFNRFIKISYCKSELIDRLNEKKSWPKSDFVWPYMKALKGAIAFASGDFESAEREFRFSSIMFKREDRFSEPRYHAELLVRLAEAEIKLGKHTHVAEHIREARDIYYKAHDRPGEGSCMIVESELSFKNEDYENAEYMGMFAAEYSRETDLFIHARGVKCLGDGKRGVRDHEFARGLYEEALQEFQKIGCDRWEGHCGYCIGELDLEEDKIQDAEHRFLKCEELFVSNKYDFGEGCSLLKLGIVYEKKGDINEARERYERALNIFYKARHRHYIDLCETALRSLR